jgi:branched-chain amino acid transport system substrate-binding protein
MQRPARFNYFAMIATLGVLAGCGTTTSSSSGAGAAGDLSGCRGTVTVATDFPLTGGDSTDGPFPERGAHLAVTQANSNHLLGGCSLKYVSKDDSTVAKNGHDPAQGAANVTALASDSSVVGVVGPFNSSVALAEIPVASQNHLALISPSNTQPGLTIAGSNPLIDTNALYKGPHTYFRVIATDAVQAKILAYVATKELNTKKAYVFDDQETYGAGIATIFKKEFATYGGAVVGTASLPGSTTTFTTQMSDAKSKGADLIFFGGLTGTGAGLARRDAVAAGLAIPFIGGDGLQDTKFVTDANSGSNSSAADGVEATSAPDVTKLSSAAKFYSDYAAAYASDPAPYNDGKKEPYTAYGYDAMQILLQSVKTVISNNGGQLPSDPQAFRDAVVAALHNTSYDGATGHLSFDQNGDLPPPSSFTLYKVSGASWTTKETLVEDTSGNVTVKS